MAAEHLRALGQRMREQREALGLTQEEVARAMPGRVTGARISKWERGMNRPHDDSLEELAKALQTNVSALLAPAADKTAGTPDLLQAAQPTDVQAQLDRIEQRLNEIYALITGAPNPADDFRRRLHDDDPPDDQPEDPRDPH